MESVKEEICFLKNEKQYKKQGRTFQFQPYESVLKGCLC